MDKKKIALLIMLGVVSTPSTLYASGRDVVKVPSYRHCTHEKMIGKDRYETGVLTTKKSKRLNNIIVVNGKEEKLVDGLCASVLIDKLDATVLPINPNKVNTDAKKIINNAKNVYIIGENEAIPYSFEESINKKVKVKRIGGKDRFETSKEIAKYLGIYDKAFLVNGVIGQADAMSMSSVSAKYKIPILLTKENSSIFDKKENIDYTVIGGTDVISNKLQNNFEAKRIGGKTRYETNKYVLNTYYPKSTIRYFTNGETLVDALSGASLSKNDGITFISRHKNHDLLEYIDTVQVGGLPYDVEFIVSDTNNNVGGGTIVKNNPPTKPEIEAKVTEKENAEGEYFVEINMTKESTDPDGDKVSYEYEGRSEDDYYSIGTHTVKVRAIDSKKATSDWFEISFTIDEKKESSILINSSSFNKKIKSLQNYKNAKNLIFETNMPNDIASKVDKIDVSKNQDNSIIAYFENDTIYIVSDNYIVAESTLSKMFDDFNYLSKIDLNNLQTNNIYDMSRMFVCCYKLQEIKGLNKIDTSQVTDMSSMFSVCRSLTSLDVSNFNTSNVKNMREMFNSCSSLTSIKGLENFDMSSIENMSSMFYNCNNLTEIIGIGNWDLNNVTNMDSVFMGCNSLTNLDVSNWKFKSLKSISNLFYNCKKLNNLDISEWNLSNLTSLGSIFTWCQSLEYLDVSGWDTSNLKNFSATFQYCDNLKEIKGIEKLDTSNVKNMSNMFSGCRSLTSLDVSNFDTSNVTDMSVMFLECESLPSLDVSNFDTSQVTNMRNMFYRCSSLTSIKGLENFDTSNMSEMDNMFEGCFKLNGSITISNPSIQRYKNIFKDCSTDPSAKFIVNYKPDCKDIAQKIVNTKGFKSNVVLGVEK